MLITYIICKKKKMYLSDILFPIENRDDYVGEYLQICESPNYVLSYYAGIWSLTPDPNCKYYQVHEAFDIKYIYYYLEYSNTKVIYDKLDTTVFISKYYKFDDAPTLEKQTSISADIEKKSLMI